MRNDERYGKGKSWTVFIMEDGVLTCLVMADAIAYKEDTTVTVTCYQGTRPADNAKFLQELSESILRVERGEIKPNWVADGDKVSEPGDEDFPF